jgi:hypothetical protein
LFKIKICSNLNFVQIQNLFMFHFLNKFEICSYLKKFQNLNFFKIKISSNSKSEQISEYKKRKQKKQKKTKKIEKKQHVGRPKMNVT